MQAPIGEPSLHSTRPANDQIGLGDLIRIIWRERWMMLVVTAACALAGGVTAYLLPKKYQAVIMLMPVTNQSASGVLSGLSSAVSQLGGVGSLMALSGVGAGGERAASIATLTSETLTERYIRENDLLPILFKKYWDPQAKRWNITDPEKMPTLWKGNEYFKKKVRTTIEDSKSGLVSIAITWTDPKMAAEWANGIVRLANSYLRDKAIAETDRNIAYLRAEVEATNDVGLKNAIYSLIESEIRKEMIARGNVDYALKVIDPAVSPEKPTSPKPALWVIGGAALGLALALAAGLLRADAV